MAVIYELATAVVLTNVELVCVSDGNKASTVGINPNEKAQEGSHTIWEITLLILKFE